MPYLAGLWGLLKRKVMREWVLEHQRLSLPTGANHFTNPACNDMMQRLLQANNDQKKSACKEITITKPVLLKDMIKVWMKFYVVLCTTFSTFLLGCCMWFRGSRQDPLDLVPHPG
jgi:hypothetical protein